MFPEPPFRCLIACPRERRAILRQFSTGFFLPLVRAGKRLQRGRRPDLSTPAILTGDARLRFANTAAFGEFLPSPIMTSSGRNGTHSRHFATNASHHAAQPCVRGNLGEIYDLQIH